MSRSLGDNIATELGVINRPDICTMQLNKAGVAGSETELASGRCVGLIAASDALYEFMTPAAVCNAACLHADYRGSEATPDGVATHMRQLAVRVQDLWVKNENGYIDDTTLVMVALH